MQVRRERDVFLLEHAGQRFVARRRLDQGRGFALLTSWGGFLANCATLAECEARVGAWVAGR